MRVGLVLRNSGTQGADAVRRITDLAAELSYDGVWASDHVVVPPSFAARYGSVWLDPFVSLAIAAERAPGLTLGFSVLVIPYRAAPIAANALATLQALSGGRVVCGVGSGFLKEEFDALGADYANRGALTDERLQQIRETVDVPMLAGGNSAKVLQRAGWLEGWHPIARSPSFVAQHARGVKRIALRARIGLGVERADRPLFGSRAEIAADIAAYRAAGVNDLVVDYAADDLDDVEQQVRQLASILQEVRDGA